jgi:hypothetical protein
VFACLSNEELLSANIAIVVLDEDVLTIKQDQHSTAHTWKYVNHSGRVFSRKPSGVPVTPNQALDRM